jgi:hypothetical protein
LGLLGEMPDARLPPDGVFDLVVHLTGMTDADVQRAAADALDVSDWRGGGLETALAERADAGRRFTVLGDAVDEAQEPFIIAQTLRRLSNRNAVRVLVGTRRALYAQPKGSNELLRALDASTRPRRRWSSSVTRAQWSRT